MEQHGLNNTDSSSTLCRVIVTSVGTAKPATSAAIASGLNLPVSQVISCLYRAPSILADGLEKELAKKMASFLTDIGYEAETQLQSEPPPMPVPLYDVALRINDARSTYSAAEKLASFTGMSQQSALDMILKPPGIVLGNVSEATIQAFSKQFGDEVTIMSSRPQDAKYNIFLTDGTEIIRNRILNDLKKLSLPLLSENGLVLSNVDYADVRELWQRYQASGLLHIVNQDFILFDLILEKQVEAHTTCPKTLATFDKYTDIPKEMIDAVIDATPIIIAENLTTKDIPEAMLAFDNAGLNTRAEATTFQTLKLELLSCENKSDLHTVLHRLNIINEMDPAPILPFKIPDPIPELNARIIRANLEDAGVDVIFQEATA